MSNVCESLLPFKPKYWRWFNFDTKMVVNAFSEEYQNVFQDLSKSVKYMNNIIFLERIQNIHDYGQFLARSQILVLDENSRSTYYQVRRYVPLPKCKKTLALMHNLDYRRLDMTNLDFFSHLDKKLDFAKYDIFIVKILTDDPKKRIIKPKYNQDYYIEYVAALA